MNQELAKYIDHTLLKPDVVDADIIKLCEQAMEYGFKTVCVNPSFVQLAKKTLEGSDVGITTVIGFPLGATTTKTKVFEACEAVDNGATDIDMVIHIGALKDRKYDYVQTDIEQVVSAVAKRAIVKVIIETCLLTDEEKKKVCLIAKMAGADFVKTSTGFSTGGATREDVMLMRETVGEDMGVKASGGLKKQQDVEGAIKAGANRVGTSASVDIVKD
jgi:deoxyribose-phosphate aldolase